MCIFGLADLQARFAAAGFVDIDVLPQDVPEYWIPLESWPAPIVARRPS
jgi:hypothetical protein